MLLSPEVAWDALRLETASAVLLLTKASSAGASQKAGIVTEEDWLRLMTEEKDWVGQPVNTKTNDGKKEVRCPPLLTPKEVSVLKGLPADLQSLQCQAWALRVIKRDKTLQGPVRSRRISPQHKPAAQARSISPQHEPAA